MKSQYQEPADGKLASLLRESRPAPGLPPRFQENVWKRIEHPAPVAVRAVNWVDALAALLLKPRVAFAGLSALLLAGLLLGSLDGAAHARHDAQERYLAAVVMPVAP